MRLWPSLRAMLAQLLDATRPPVVDVPPPPAGTTAHMQPSLESELHRAGWALFATTPTDRLMRGFVGRPN